ncbi:MAG: Ig-like domain-containing protein [Bacteroidota bacterium]
MKRICIMLVLCCLAIAGHAQTTLIQAGEEGGFELGTTFPANGWTAVNDSSNMWVVNDLTAAYSGRCAYISTSGSTYDYTTSASRTSHFYRDVAIPAGATSITLSFRWKGQGDTAFDRMLVYRAPTTVTPVARTPLSNSTAISGATLLWSQPFTSTSYSLATLTLPGSLAGTTVRLIFTWQNNGSGGAGGPAAIDNIGLTYVSACSGTPSAGTASATFTSGCTGYNATLSLAGASSGGGITYQWQSSTDTTTWTNVSGASTTTAAVTINSNIYYRCRVTCTSSGTSVTSNAILFSASTPSVTYATLPFSESFEGTWINSCGTKDVPSTKWVNTPGYGNNSWRRSDDTLSPNSASWTSPASGKYTPLASAGSNSARFHTIFASLASTGKLDLYINLSSTATKTISYSYINTTGSDKLYCQISTNGGSTFTTLDSVTTASSWTTRTITTTATSATAIVRFMATSDFGLTDIGLDNVSITTPSYCSPSFSDPANSCNTYGIWTRLTSLTGYSGTITDGTACSPTGYLNLTAMSCTLMGGSAYTASIMTGQTLMSCQFWIDFNDDNVFQTTESIGGNASYSYSGSPTVTITIPSGSTTGSHRMRLVSNYMGCCGGQTYPAIPPCPTSAITYGECRDYTVTIASPCSTPSAITGSAALCQGSATTLSDTTAGGSWLSGNTAVATVGSATGIVTGVAGGTATISYVVSGGCSVTRVVTVTALPIGGIQTGLAHVATGSTVTLSDMHLRITIPAAVAGQKAFSASHYNDGTTANWGGIPATFSNVHVRLAPSSDTFACGTIGTGYFSGKVALIYRGTCDFSYKALQAQNAGAIACVIINNVAGSPGAMGIGSVGASVTIPVYMITQADGAALAARLNAGDSVKMSMTANDGGGSWSSDNTAKATVSGSGVVTGVDTGTATILYTVSNACGSSAPVTFMAVHSPITITGSTVMCAGNITTYTGSPAGGTWTSSNTAVATIGSSSGIVTAVGAGSATISYFSPAGYPAASSLTVYASPAAITGSTLVDIGATTTLSNASFFGMWSSSNASVATIGSTNGVVTGIATGSVIMTYTLGTGCTSTFAMNAYSSGSLPAASCTPSYIYNSVACFTDGINISNFLVTGASGSNLSDPSSCSGTGFESMLHLGVSMVQNGAYTATIYCSGGYSENVQVWIDFNNDGIYSSSESVGGYNGFTSAGAAFTLNIPYGSATGVHRMRVLTSYSGTGFTYPDLNPCATGYYYGDARDYTANILSMSPCTGTPVVGNISSNPGSACASESVTLSAPDIALAGGLTFQWQVSADTTTWSNISGATNLTHTMSLSASAYYRLVVTCSGSGITTTTNALRVVYTTGCYCTPSYYYGAPASTYQMLNFSLTGYSGSSLNDNGPLVVPAGGYENRTTMTINLRQNDSYSGSMTYTNSYYYYMTQVWIDYNDDGVFSNSETVTPIFGNNCSVPSASTTFTMNVPHTATLGLHRMRVRQTMTYTCSLPAYLDPCATGDGINAYYYGMTRDYMANIAPMPDCSGTPVAGVAVTSTGAACSSTPFTLTVTGATLATGLTYQWQTSTDTTTWSNITGATTENYTTSASATAYYRRVVTCGFSGASAASTNVGVFYTSACACTPTYYYGASAHTYQTANFSLTGHGGSNINDNGPATVVSGGYQNRTGISIDLKQGGAYAGSETYTHSYYYYITQVWIDYNDNATFETSEIVTPVFGLDCSAPYASSSFNMNIQADAAPGTHLMRVRQAMTYNCTTLPVMEPCNTGDGLNAYYYGMTRDYMANILPCTSAPTAGTISGTAAFCQGTTSNFSVMPVGGTWSSSNTALATVGTSGIVTGVAAGSATISYTVSNSCGTTSSTRIATINPLPEAGTITGPDSVIVGSTVTFTSPTGDAGGVWTSSNPAIASTDSFGHILGVVSGSAAITYTTTSACGTDYAVKYITVTSPATGYCVPYNYYGYLSHTYSMANFSVTGHGSSSINDNGPAAHTYYYQDRSFISVDMRQGGSYSGTETYTHNYNYYINQIWIDFNDNHTFETSEIVTPVYGDTTCASVSAANFTMTIPAGANTGTHIMRVRQAMTYTCTIPVMMDPCNYYGYGQTYYMGVARDYSVTILPCSGTPAVSAITGTASVCAASTTTLFAMPTDGTWSSSNTAVGTISSAGVVAGISAGTTTISYTVSNTCGVNVSTRIVTVNPLPNAGTITGADTVIVGSIVTLSNATADAGWWYSTVPSVATMDSFGHATGVLSGSTIISYTTTNLCGTANTTKTLYVTSPAAAYCYPSTYYGATATTYSMANFSLSGYGGSTINDNGPTVVPANYEDRTFISVDLEPGGTYAGSETYTHSYYQYNSQVWIDFNDNSTFESSERVTPVFGQGCGSYISSSTFTLSIPATANPGLHIMRVRQAMTSDCDISLEMNPCSYYDGYNYYYYGLARDYRVNILTPAACTGTPTAGVATASTTHACSTTVVTLTVSGATIASGLTFQWQSSPNNSTWTNISGATTYPYTFTGVSSSTYYRAVITCGASSAPSTAAFITATPCYCVPAYSYGYDACSYYHIDIKAFNLAGELGTAINDSTACDGTGYTQLLGYTTTLQQSTAYTAYIAGSSASYYQAVQAWIDFDNNGTFESSETVGGYNYFYGEPQPFTITIPSGVLGGNHRMRVRSSHAYSSYPSMDPCATYYYGNTRDYTVNISSSAICSGTPVPGTVNASVLTACTSYTSSLTLADSATTSLTGMMYQWQTTTDTTGTWTNITGATDNAYTASVTATGYYRNMLTCATSSLSAATPAKRLVLASAPAITGTAVVCVGSYTSFTGTPYGGTWSTSDTSVATVNVAGDIYGLSAGTATISYNNATSGAGCANTRVVTVNAMPAAYTITGGGSFCATGTGVTVGLSGSSAGTSYTLYRSSAVMAGPMAGTGSGLSFGLQTVDGTYYVLATNTATGCSGPMAGTVTISSTSVPAITGTLSACAGNTSSLANTASGGVWSSTNASVASINASTGVVTAVAAGSATISYTLAAGCYTTAIFSVNPIPAMIMGMPSVCVASSTNLTNATTGGVWSSSNTTTATVGATSGVVTGHNAGTVTITYTIGSGCGSVITLTVNPLPPAITGTAIVCVGLTTTLADTVTGGTWGSTATSIATVGATSGIVTGVAAGVTTITYTLPTGCITTKSVTVNPLPVAITGTRSVCRTAVTNLYNATPAGNWSSANTAIATVTSTGAVTGVAVGTVFISYTLSTGCVALAIVTVNPLPYAIAGTMSLCPGSTTTLSDTAAGGLWTSSSTAIATIGSNTGILNAVSSGEVTITYTLGSGCSVTATVTVNALPSAIGGSLSACLGGTTTLSSASAGGTWLSANGTVATIDAASGIVSGVGTGTSRITYTIASGCRTMATVTVHALPASITGALSACAGGSSNLSSTTSGGTWSTGDVSIATINSTGTVTAVAAGTVTISYTVGTGCTRTAIYTVNALPAAISGTLTMCIGGNTTLTNATGGGMWSGSNPSIANVAPTGVVSGASAGTANVSYTIMASGCRRIVQVTVNGSPATIAGPATVCAGGSATYTNTTSGGTWASSNTAVATIGSSTGILATVSAGTATLTYTTGTGCYSTKLITVNAAPTAITGTTSVCAGATTSLSNSGGVSWTSSTTSVATINSTSGIVTGVSAGTTTITYSFGTGCNTTTVVTVNALPATITGTASVCIGAATTLSNTVTGGTWSSSTTTVATIDATSGIVNGIASGTTIVTYTLGTGCYRTITVTVNALPASITGTTAACVGAATTLANATAGGTWSSSSTAVATVGVTTGIVTGVSAGSATITYRLGTGCIATTSVSINPAPAAIGGSLVVCMGSITTLTNTTTGGTWSSSNGTVASIGSATGIATGIGAGTATITYTAGCRITAVITVNALPANITGTLSACEGSATTLANATTGGMWSSSDGSVAGIGATTGIVNGIAAGNATISYTLPTGCYKTANVTINGLPGTITGTANVCAGSTTTLANTTTGGTWSSSTTSIATVGITSGVVTGVVAGTATITYATGTGCRTTAVVTVEPLPAAISGAGSICIGGSLTLTNTSTGGTWSSSNTAVATIGSASGILTAVASGTATITYTLPTGCRVTATVTANPAPSIMGTLTVCSGQATTLSNTTTGGTWTSGDASVATIGTTSGIVSGVSAGTAEITYTTPAGCGTTAIVTVNAAPAAITGNSPMCVGYELTLASTTTGGTWSSSSTAVATVDASGVVTGAGVGNATITYALAGGCMATATVTVNTIPNVITGTAEACAGSTTNLASTTSGGTWSSSDASVATISPSVGIVTGVSAGTATVSYTLGTGCARTVTVTINALPAAITGTAAVCVGSATTLSSTTTGGTWSSSNAGIASVGAGTGIVSGVSAGTATVTYMLATGCRTTATVTVIAMPAGITGTASVCEGSVTTFSNTTTGGTWSSSDATTATVGATDGAVAGISAGTATITYTTGTGCVLTRMVTVNALPTAIAGTATVCVGAATTLSSTPSGGTWSSGSTANATITTSTGIVTGVAAGTSAITYTTTTGCTVITDVTVNALPAAITGSATGCVGTTTSLASTTTGGTWTSSNTAIATVDAGGVVTGVATGATVITYTIGTGCYTTHTVTINALPATIGGTLTVCAGAATTLSNASTGGTWSSSTTSVATVTASTGIVTGVASGNATITYSMGGCITVAEVTVNALPAAITGTASVCTGATTSLASITTGGTWSSSNTAVATIDNTTGVATGVSAGTATITYTSGAGCYTTTAVTVNTVAAITGTTTLCTGASATLANATTGGTWSSSNGAVATIGSANGVVNAVAAGNAGITYTSAAGCATTTTVTVNAAPAAIAGSASVCVGSATTLTNTTTGGTWSSSTTGVATIGSATGIANGTGSGTAIITYTLPTGCFTTMALTANPIPGPISGTASVCEGLTTILSNGTPGGTWSSSDMTVATIGTTGIVTGILAGNTTVSYTLATGCARMVTVTVNTSPAALTGTTTICGGGTTTLSSTTTGGAWTSSNAAIASVNSSGIVTAGTPGVATITYTVSGCRATASVTVTAAPPAITGTRTMCAGAATTLANAISGGTWSSSNTSIATVGSSTGIVSGVAAGTATVSYATGAGCTATAVVTVNAVPAAITGTLSTCIGSTTSLSNATTGGTAWSSSNPAVGTVGAMNGVVRGNTAGTTNITYTLGTGCYTTAIVTVNAAPSVIGGPGIACIGTTSTLTNTVTGGTWTSSNTARATVDASTGVVTGVSAGILFISYATGTGCVTTKQVTVNVSPTPISGYATPCEGTTTTLTSGTGAWSSSDMAVGTINSSTRVFTGLTPGTTTITFTNPTTGCAATYALTVVPTPPAITGTPTACMSATSLLSNSQAGGVWVTSNAGVAAIGATTGLVTASGTSFGVVTISYTFGPNCRVTRAFTVNTLPAAIGGGPYTVCAGATTTLSDVTPGGTWSSSNGAIATVGTGASPSYGAVTGVSAGMASISYTLTATGCSRSATVTVNASPNAGVVTGPFYTINTTTAPTSVTLSSSGDAGGTWTSSNTGIATVGAGTGVVSAVGAGNANITYTVTLGSCTARATHTVNVTAARPGGSTTATDAAATATISVFPNPTTGSFTVQTDEAGIFHLFTIDGKSITQYEVNIGSTTVALPQDLAAGVYMCRFNGNNGSTVMVRLVYEP